LTENSLRVDDMSVCSIVNWIRYAQLCAVCLSFVLEHGRPPTFWLDKVCVDQSQIARNLRCLPVFVTSCDKLLVLYGETYSRRLWCVLELYIHFAMSGSAASERCAVSSWLVHTMSPFDCDLQASW
jgi:hypothetical protein